MKKLTAQQQSFVTAYLADPAMNATKAYRKAYSKSKGKASESNSAILIRNHKVRDAIDKVLEKRAVVAEKKEIVSREMFLNELAKSLKYNGSVVDSEDGKKICEPAAHNKAVEMAGRLHAAFLDRKEVSNKISIEDEVKSMLDD